MVFQLIPLAAGAAARMAGARMATSAVASGGSPAAGQAAQFGGRALQMSAMAKNPRQPAHDGGHLGSKGEAGLAVLASGVLSGPRALDSAANNYYGVMQAGQFKSSPQTP